MKKLGKISALTVIAALFVFAFAGAAFAEETDEEMLVQPDQIEEHELPVGGWAPAEPIYVPTDLVVNNGDNSGKTQSSKRRINSDPNSVFTKGAATTGYEALDEAQKEGVLAAEIYLSSRDSFRAMCVQGQIANYTVNDTRGLIHSFCEIK